ncbi:hypothetical protein H4S06_002083 [Coemansia sp. BCRC 34490]|nr:hypothetical protein H4S06_002083 [Coemansia sp. BCRC 34490]
MKVPALAKYTVRDVLDYRGSATLHHAVAESDTIEDALALMHRLDIVSVPVFRCPGEAKPGGASFVGIVTVYDLRDYIVSSPVSSGLLWHPLMASKSPVEQNAFGAGVDDEVEFQQLAGHASGNATVLQTPVARVVESRSHAPREIAASAPLESLLRLFAEHSQHAVLVAGVGSESARDSKAQQVPHRRRGASVDSGCSSVLSTSPGSAHDEAADTAGGHLLRGAVCGLTQYDVLGFVQHHNHELGHGVLDTTVGELVGCHRPLPATVAVRDSALHALRRLADARAPALPVVDADGRLVAEVAGASLRGLTTQSIALLGKPVLAYILGLRIAPRTDPYVVAPSFTVAQIMYGMLRINCRRAWVVDSRGRPLAVVSLADVLRLLL